MWIEALKLPDVNRKWTHPLEYPHIHWSLGASKNRQLKMNLCQNSYKRLRILGPLYNKLFLSFHYCFIIYKNILLYIILIYFLTFIFGNDNNPCYRMKFFLTSSIPKHQPLTSFISEGEKYNVIDVEMSNPISITI